MFINAEMEFVRALDLRKRILAPADQIESSRISLNETRRRIG